MNVIKQNEAQEKWKTYTIGWNDNESTLACPLCQQLAFIPIGLAIKSEKNTLICNKCAVQETPLIAEALFLHRLHEDPKDEDAASYLADIKQTRLNTLTEPTNLSKNELEQIHGLTNSVKVLIWSESSNDLETINFLVPKKWLLNNDKFYPSIFAGNPKEKEMKYIPQSSFKQSTVQARKLYEKALEEGVIIAQSIE